MKRILQVYILMLLPIFTWAGPIDEETAKQQASAFLDSRQAKARSKAPTKRSELKLMYAKRLAATEMPLLYVFGNKDEGGFVVIAGDDIAINPVLGYSDCRLFNADSIPCCLNFLLDEYARQLSETRKVSTISVHRAQTSSKAPIPPLVTSKWGQREPYNNLCPKSGIDSTRCVTGCVATAMAQFLYYYKWPKQGVGNHTYKYNGITHTVDFGSTTYLWDKMKDTYSGDDGDTENAVATLMYHCGVAVNMQYGPHQSGAYISKAISALKNYFSYSKIRNTEARTTDNLEDRLYTELSVKCPILVEGAINNEPDPWNKRHFYIIDGYNEGYFHFNFGWEGNWDGYYLLNAVDPDVYLYKYGVSYYTGFRKSGFTIDNCDYCISPDGGATLVKGMVSGNVTIPRTIQIDGNDYTVKSIEDSAFYGCKDLISVSIPQSVTSIGVGAFERCTGLTSVLIPEGVTIIGDDAFKYCTGLTSVVIPNGVTTLGDRVFKDCENLSSIEIPKSVVSFGYDVFYGTSWLINQPDGLLYLDKIAYKYIGEMPANTTIEIREGTISIATGAFRNCSGLVSITIPESVTSIGKGAFGSCKNLPFITIPESVTSIEVGAFSSCISLSSIVIPKSVTSISSSLFYGCSNLASVTLHCSTIGDAVFYGNSSIKELILGNTVTSIGDKAFMNCSKLESVNLPNSVNYIGKSAFENCKALGSLTINSLVDIDKTVFQDCSALKDVTINCPVVGTFLSGMSSIKEVHLSDNVNTIPHDAFRNCSGLEHINIPEGVMVIEKNTFEGCRSLVSIDIPISVTSIGSYAFRGCRNLSSVYIPNSVNKIGSYAFSGCSTLSSIRVPDSVKEFGEYMFQNCKNLETVILPNTLTIIPRYTFKGCSSLMTIQIPKSVVSIGDYAYSGCSGLVTIDIPESITRIGHYAFSGCSGASSAILPNSVIKLGHHVFYGCTLLESVSLSKKLTQIPNYTFQYCESLTSFAIPDSVKVIGDCAFSDCTGLTSVSFHDNFTYIGQYAFYNCKSLTSITIPRSILRISYNAFQRCDSLTAVTINRPPLYIDRGTFSNRENAILYVPYGYKKEFTAAQYWNEFKEIIEMECVMGDVNGDGYINNADIDEIAKYIMGLHTSAFNEHAADINEDGVVNVADIVQILNLINNKQ